MSHVNFKSVNKLCKFYFFFKGVLLRLDFKNMLML